MVEVKTPSHWLNVTSWLRQHMVVVLSIIGLALLVGLDYWTLWPILSRPANRDTAAAVAAAITVNGVLLTAAVTYVGLLFKRSADNRAAGAVEQANRMAELEEQRLHMEAAMKAVSLLATDGKAAPNYQTSALLIVLAELGQLSLAVELAAELWPINAITRTCGVELVDRCIASGSTELRLVGMRLLAANARALVFTRVVAGIDGQEEQIVQSWPKNLGMLDQAPRDPLIETLLEQARIAAADEASRLEHTL